jgi:hypothetical protein
MAIVSDLVPDLFLAFSLVGLIGCFARFALKFIDTI